jgi:hypothetical protein
VAAANPDPATAPQPRRTAPSFNCAKARSTSEKLICGDEELARLDRELGALHQRARQAAPDGRAFQKSSDAAWQQREATCRDRDCLLRWYAQRRAELSSELAAAPRTQPQARSAPEEARAPVTQPVPRPQARRLPAPNTTAQTDDGDAYEPPPRRPRPLAVPGPAYQPPLPPSMGMGAGNAGVPTAEGSAGTP